MQETPQKVLIQTEPKKHPRFRPQLYSGLKPGILIPVLNVLRSVLPISSFKAERFNVKMNSEPTPSVETTLMFSSWAFRISLTIERPEAPFPSCPLRGRVGLVEALEDLLLVLLGNADAGVLDGDVDLLPRSVVSMRTAAVL